MNQTFTGPSLLDVLEAVPYGRYFWRAVRLPLALTCAVLAQVSFIARRDDASGGVVWLVAAVGIFILSLRIDRPEIPQDDSLAAVVDKTGVRWRFVGLAILLSLLTYATSSDNTFTGIGVWLWASSVAAWLAAFWDGPINLQSSITRFSNWLRSPAFTIRFSRSLLLFLAMMVVAVFCRYYRLDAVPPEMTSDHVEKLLDVNDVLEGQPSIFFPRNTGREPLQFYLSAFIARTLGTGLSHLTLKIGSSLVAVLTIPFIYLLGRELGDETLGLIAGTLASVALWPQTISRVGLRFPFSPVFVAPTLYFLLRGLRRGTRNDFLLAGFFLGAGLYGYTSFRIVPVFVGVAAAMFGAVKIARRQNAEAESAFAGRLAMMAIVAFAVFVPLFHYSVEVPEMFWYRILGRVSDAETQLPGPPAAIFLSNEWNSLRMFNWTSDVVWVNTVPNRPVLDTLAGGMFILGAAYVLFRLVTRPNVTDAVLLIGVPFLLLPSTLSLAFPNENPSVVRSASAIPLVFLIAAFPE
ncbi:MAG: glycosyltransferase family 39 protein [Chloroflexi bacterium]|nr:glycosyltransferase family 39 protein [Chloroflexota bacterium]